MTDMMLRCFMTAVETLNFTTAAEKMFITQPAFSRNIVLLEEEIGFQLFLRSKKNGLRITPAGIEFYNGVRKLFEEYDQLITLSKSIDRGESGELIIGVISGSVLDSKTMTTIKKFSEIYPNVKVTLKCYSVSKMIEAVENGGCDVCFMISSAVKDKEDLLSEEVLDVDNYVYIPRNQMPSDASEYSIVDLKDNTFILSEDVPYINNLMISICKAGGFEPKTIMAPDYETKMLWCGMGMGIAINSEGHYMSKNSAIKVAKIKEIGSEKYALIWHKQNYNPSIALLYSMFE